MLMQTQQGSRTLFLSFAASCTVLQVRELEEEPETGGRRFVVLLAADACQQKIIGLSCAA